MTHLHLHVLEQAKTAPTRFISACARIRALLLPLLAMFGYARLSTLRRSPSRPSPAWAVRGTAC